MASLSHNPDLMNLRFKDEESSQGLPMLHWVTAVGHSYVKPRELLRDMIQWDTKTEEKNQLKSLVGKHLTTL